MASSITARPAKAAAVEQKVKDCTCLCCDASAVTRGLCDKHYRTFLRRMKEKGTVADQAEFEAKAIKQGLVLSQQQVREIKRNDPCGDL